MIRRKILYIVCIVALLISNILYFNYEFFIMLLLALIIPLISLLLHLISSISLKINFYVPVNHIALHNPIELYTHMTNAFHIPISAGRLKIVLEYSEDDQRDEIVIPLEEAHHNKSNNELSIQPVHCGVMNIIADTYTWFDYTRIFHSSKRMDGSKQINVFPIIDRGKLQQLLPKTIFDNNMERGIGQTGDEITDYRKYEQGDPLNHVHWKLSTRSDELIVKDYNISETIDHVILVDLSVLDEADYRSHLDDIYQAAYSIGFDYISQSKQSQYIVWNDKKQRIDEFPFFDKESLDHALILLMQVNCSKNSLPKLYKGVQSRHQNDTAVLVTGQNCQERYYDTYYVPQKDSD